MAQLDEHLSTPTTSRALLLDNLAQWIVLGPLATTDKPRYGHFSLGHGG